MLHHFLAFWSKPINFVGIAMGKCGQNDSGLSNGKCRRRQPLCGRDARSSHAPHGAAIAARIAARSPERQITIALLLSTE